MVRSYAMSLLLGAIAMECGQAAQPGPVDVHIDACRAVVDAANLGKLAALLIADSGLEKVDINNDGKPERVEFAQGGIEVYDDEGNSIALTQSNENDWESGNLQDATNLSLIKYGKQIYILANVDERPRYLARVDGKNVERVVCEFGLRNNPIETLVKSVNAKLCQAVLSEELEYVQFDRQHALSTESLRQSGFDADHSGRLAAYVDIGNDGKKAYVVGVGFSSGGGNTCDGVHLWVLNNARNKQDAAISQKIPEWICGSVDRAPFTFEGQTYVKARGAGERPTTHRVVQLKRGRLNEICQFDLKATYYVLGEYERILANAESAHVDPWVYALEMPGTDGIRAMIDAKHDLRIKVRDNVFGTVIHEAIRRGKYDDLKCLLENDADPNVRASDDSTDPTNEPPLIFAIRVNSVESVRLLLMHGANPNTKWYGKLAKDWINISVHADKDKAVMLKLLSKK